MPAANMTETLQLPALQVPEQQVVEGGRAWSSSSTPTLRRKRFKMRRMKNVQEQSLEPGRYQDFPSSSKEFLQLPSIEITPSSDEDTPWSNCSTPSASPRRKRFLLRKWLRVREKKEYSESRYLFCPAACSPFPELPFPWAFLTVWFLSCYTCLKAKCVLSFPACRIVNN
uniref:Uncharacterized protein n=1 Tax=Dromaius novaehollandiae TaxID=8790 RepID=A0A8C4KMN7_DRONO